MPNQYSNYDDYARRGMDNTDYLAFRHVRDLDVLRNKVILDLGCGAGRSSRFLKDLDNDVTGIDISLSAIERSSLIDPEGKYLHISRTEPLPFVDGAFDAVFSSWMVLEEGDDAVLLNTLRECNRVLSDTGIAVIITNTPEFYCGDWLSCDVNHEENTPPLISGQKVRVTLVPEGQVLEDYYRSDEHYRTLFKKSGFVVERSDHPMGRGDDPVEWRDELDKPPYVVYTLRKDEYGDII